MLYIGVFRLGFPLSFYWLHYKWNEMDQNVKPQTLVKTFIQANYMYISILEYTM